MIKTWPQTVGLCLALLFCPGPFRAAAAQVYNYPGRFLGVCYDASHYDMANSSNYQVTADAYAKDFPVVAAKGFKVVRGYMLGDTAHYLNFVGEAYRCKLKAVVEVAVNPNFPAGNAAAIATFKSFLENVKATPETLKGKKRSLKINPYITVQNVDYVTPSMFSSTVILVLTGNENIPAAAKDSNSIIALKQQIDQALSVNGFPKTPVTYDFQCDVWTADPKIYPNRTAIINSLDSGVPILMNSYPFQWGAAVNESVTGGNMSNSLQDWVNRVSSFYPAGTFEKHPIIFGETGWASAGTWQAPTRLVLGNLQDEVNYLGRVYKWTGDMAKNAKTLRGVLLFEAFDQETKPGQSSERNYGLWYGGTPKSPAKLKLAIPSPPAISHTTIAMVQNAADGGKVNALTLRGNLADGTLDPAATGAVITLDGNVFKLPASGFKKQGDKTVFAGADGVAFTFASQDEFNAAWTFSLKDMALSKLDNRDGVDISIVFGDTAHEFNYELEENSTWTYDRSEDSSMPLSAAGQELEVFIVDASKGRYNNYTGGKTRMSFSGLLALPPGGAFDPRTQAAMFQVDSWRVEIPAGGFQEQNDGKLVFKSKAANVDLSLSFAKGGFKALVTAPDAWRLLTPHDGLDVYLGVGDYKSGARLHVNQRLKLKHQANRVYR